jgi:predicted membrane protein
MSIDTEYNQNREPRKNRTLGGLILMGIGIAFLIRQIDFFFIPYWLFSFPTLLILVGLYFGAKHNFRNGIWIVFVIWGGFWLMDDIFPFHHFGNAIVPLIIIVIGMRMIMNRNRPWDKERWKKEWSWRVGSNTEGPVADYTTINPNQPGSFGPGVYNDDHLDATSIFSGVKKKILSKDFKGGEITNFFGGCDVDFTSADINGRVMIDVTQVFGGIKLIVPPHWHVTSDMVNLFAGFDDKRMQKSDYGSDKILVLKGTSIFAGVEIRSY